VLKAEATNNCEFSAEMAIVPSIQVQVHRPTISDANEIKQDS